MAQDPVQEADARLARGLQEGRPEAVGELCDRMGPRLYRFAAARLPGDGQAAEEVMTLALTDAARNITRYDPRRSTFASWLFGNAARKLRDAARREHWLKSVPRAVQTPLESLGEMADQRDLADELVARVDAQRQAVVLARVLSHLEFTVLALSSVEELTAREVGQVVGRSERAVHSILHRARQKARERLAHDG